MASSTEESDELFYHRIANLALYMAEDIFGVATIGVTNITLWPPICSTNTYENWNWPPRSKGLKLFKKMLKFFIFS